MNDHMNVTMHGHMNVTMHCDMNVKIRLSLVKITISFLWKFYFLFNELKI
jgi:hypothetical protein